MFAEATSNFLSLTIAIIGAIASLIAIGSFFATRTEVIDLKERVNKTETLIEKLREEGSRRGRQLFRRSDALNALLQRVAERLHVHVEGDFNHADDDPDEK